MRQKIFSVSVRQWEQVWGRFAVAKRGSKRKRSAALSMNLWCYANGQEPLRFFRIGKRVSAPRRG